MRSRRNRLVWHPLLFAVWPVVSLYRKNLGEVPLGQALTAMAVAAVITMIVLVVLTLLLREARRAALLTSVLVITVLLWGAASDAAGDPPWLFGVWVGTAALLSVAVLRVRSTLPELTQIAAGISVVVLALALVPVVVAKGPILLATAAVAAPSDDLAESVGQWSVPGEPRDIYYLVFDRYGSQEAMEARWNMDLSPFFDGLKDRGFFVARDSKANHLRTAQSLASTLHLRYLTGMEEQFGTATGDLLPVYSLLQDHPVGSLLQQRGYRYVHVGAWWDPTQSNRHADVNISYETKTDFGVALRRSTLLSWFDSAPQGRSRAEQARQVPYEGAQQQFAAIREAATDDQPTFTFAHVLLPHEPFVYDRNGSYVTLAESKARTREHNYREQTLHTNTQIEQLVDDLLDVPEEQQPIIVLAADEGPAPVRFIADDENFDWTTATAAELEEKFAILNAYYLPGIEDAALYPSISPVNNWRVIFRAYFGADLELLEDRSYVFRNEHAVYDFTDVTDRLGGPIP